MAQRRRRSRGLSRHPGVTLKKRTYASGRTAWRARYRDPLNGRVVYVTLDGPELGLRSREARVDWAMRLSERLARQRAAVAAGEIPIQRVPVSDAIEGYMGHARLTLRPGTVATYSDGIDRFVRWAAGHGVEFTDQLNGPGLMAFREALVAEPRRVAVAGGRRGERRDEPRPRSPTSINSNLRSIKAMLNHWRKLGQVPRLDRDAISDSLSPLRAPRPQPRFLRPADIRALLEAALRHDADTFKATRNEHARGEGSATRRHDPITPFLVFLLLSGCRPGEALGLRWDSIDFEAHDGAGEIVLAPEETKTWIGRAVLLAVSPALRDLLAALKLRSGGGRYVFGGEAKLSRNRIEVTRRRLVAKYGAAAFTWKQTRATAATFMVNASSVYGGAAAYRAAKQLGHSVVVCEKHYAGLVTVPAGATTLEAAMGIEDLVANVVRPMRVAI